MNKNKKICSFCSLNEMEIDIIFSGILFSGKDGNICNLCVEKLAKEMDSKQQIKSDNKIIEQIKLLKPIEIKNELDNYIIGQDRAKKVLSVAIYNHFKRINNLNDSKDDVDVEKSNVILVGKTGTGKTLLAKTIARLLNVPFCIADATVLTQAGYVGEDVESIISRLLQLTDFDVKLVEKGIIFIDEIDKISRKNDNPSITRDVSGEGVQQALLKLIEGSIVSVPPQGGRKHPEQKLIKVDTKNILFICGGAFDGIENIISRRFNQQFIGYSAEKKQRIENTEIIQYVLHQDLKKMGLIPELLGRFPVISSLQDLDLENLRQILTKPKNALIKQYKKLFEIENIELHFEDDVIDFIAKKSMDFNLGARGLRTICETIIIDLMFELPSKNIKIFTITLEYAKKKLNQIKIN